MKTRICAYVLLCAVTVACRTAPPERVVDCRRELEQVLRGAPLGIFRLEYHPDVLASIASIEFALYPNTHSWPAICSYGVPGFSGALAGHSDARVADLQNCALMTRQQLDRRRLMCMPAFAEPDGALPEGWIRGGGFDTLGAAASRDSDSHRTP